MCMRDSMNQTPKFNPYWGGRATGRDRVGSIGRENSRDWWDPYESWGNFCQSKLGVDLGKISSRFAYSFWLCFHYLVCFILHDELFLTILQFESTSWISFRQVKLHFPRLSKNLSIIDRMDGCTGDNLHTIVIHGGTVRRAWTIAN